MYRAALVEISSERCARMLFVRFPTSMTFYDEFTSQRTGRDATAVQWQNRFWFSIKAQGIRQSDASLDR